MFFDLGDNRQAQRQAQRKATVGRLQTAQPIRFFLNSELERFAMKLNDNFRPDDRPISDNLRASVNRIAAKLISEHKSPGEICHYSIARALRFSR